MTDPESTQYVGLKKHLDIYNIPRKSLWLQTNYTMKHVS